MRSRAWKKISRRWWRLVVAKNTLVTKDQFFAFNQVADLSRRRGQVVSLIEAVVLCENQD